MRAIPTGNRGDRPTATATARAVLAAPNDAPRTIARRTVSSRPHPRALHVRRFDLVDVDVAAEHLSDDDETHESDDDRQQHERTGLDTDRALDSGRLVRRVIHVDVIPQRVDERGNLGRVGIRSQSHE